MEEVKKEKKEKEKALNKEKQMDIYSTFDFNNMTNKERIIISLLCEEDLIYSIKQVSDIVQMKEEYVKKLYEQVKYNINNLEKEKTKYEYQ